MKKYVILFRKETPSSIAVKEYPWSKTPPKIEDL